MNLGIGRGLEEVGPKLVIHLSLDVGGKAEDGSWRETDSGWAWRWGSGQTARGPAGVVPGDRQIQVGDGVIGEAGVELSVKPGDGQGCGWNGHCDSPRPGPGLT